MGVGGEKFQLGTVGALSLSVVSSVSIVICNKALMSSLGFNFGVRSDWFLPQFLDLLCVYARAGRSVIRVDLRAPLGL
jgi:solute carrier family 35 protein E3